MILSGISITVCLYLLNQNNQYKEAYHKYKGSLYFKTSSEFIDSAYYHHEEHVIETIDSVEAAIEKRKELEEELIETKGKTKQLEKELSSTQ